MSVTTDFPLPEGLPVPQDDGAADHLRGFQIPPLTLSATDGTAVNLADLGGYWVLYIYPMTGQPGVALPDGWDAIRGREAARRNHALFAIIMRRCRSLVPRFLASVPRIPITNARRATDCICLFNC